MTVTEYIKRKNKIIFDEIGVTLVPESQIEECEQWGLNMHSDAAICPYCLVYDQDGGDNSCNGCPMFDAGNDCNAEDWDSTWRDVCKELKMEDGGTYYIFNYPNFHQKLENLVNQYNEELKNGLQDT